MAELFLLNLLSQLGYQLIGVAIFLPFELLWPKSRVSFAARANGLIFLLATAFLMALTGLAIFWLKNTFQIEPLIVFRSTFGGPIIASIALAIWGDLQFYVLHRLEHRFLWRFHRVHHSIRNLSAANSYHHWTEAIWLQLAAIPLLFINVGIGPTLGILVVAFHFWQFYIHSACQPHLGPLRQVMVDNRFHRIHHSLDPAHHGKNFGAFTTLWDRLFGTAYVPRSSEWPDVGLDDLSEPQGLREWHSAPWRSRNSESLDLPASRESRSREVLLDRDRTADAILIP